MKSVHALAIALALGLAGALLNFVYLNKASQGTDMAQFIGVKGDRQLGPGDRIEPKRTSKAYRFRSVGPGN